MKPHPFLAVLFEYQQGSLFTFWLSFPTLDKTCKEGHVGRSASLHRLQCGNGVSSIASPDVFMVSLTLHLRPDPVGDVLGCATGLT
jgi:hypothetical protein